MCFVFPYCSRFSQKKNVKYNNNISTGTFHLRIGHAFTSNIISNIKHQYDTMQLYAFVYICGLLAIFQAIIIVDNDMKYIIVKHRYL